MLRVKSGILRSQLLKKSVFLQHQQGSGILNSQNLKGQISELSRWNSVPWAAYLRRARLPRLRDSWDVAASAGSFMGPLFLLLPRIEGEGCMGPLSSCDPTLLGCQGPLGSKLKVSTAAAYGAPPAPLLITLPLGAPPRGGFMLKSVLWWTQREGVWLSMNEALLPQVITSSNLDLCFPAATCRRGCSGRGGVSAGGQWTALMIHVY